MERASSTSSSDRIQPGKGSIFLVVALFAGLLVAGDRALSFLGKSVLDHSSNRFVRVYAGELPPGIVVVGNSRADRHFPANALSRRLGTSVVNLGIGGESMVLAEALIRDYLDRNQKPLVVIVEISCLRTDPDSLGEMHFFGLYSERIERLARDITPKWYYTLRLFNLGYFNNFMAYRVAAGLVRPETDRLHSAQISPQALEAFRQLPVPTPNSYKENIAALQRIVELAAERGITLRLIESPYVQIFDDKRRLEEMWHWAEKTRSELPPSATLLNYSDKITGREYFRDRVHLNKKGVGRFMDILVKDGVFASEP